MLSKGEWRNIQKKTGRNHIVMPEGLDFCAKFNVIGR
jgi:hypothetical protein